MSFCNKCGKSNQDTAKFCTICGATLSAVSAPYMAVSNSKKSSVKPWMIIALVAVIALGLASYLLFFNKKGDEKALRNEMPGDTKGLYHYTSQRPLSSDELANMSQQELRIMRNEIYARHGFIFKKDDMKQYFNSQNWYTPLYNNVEHLLSDMEKKNIVLIKRYEKFQEEAGNEYGR